MSGDSGLVAILVLCIHECIVAHDMCLYSDLKRLSSIRTSLPSQPGIVSEKYSYRVRGAAFLLRKVL